MKLSERTIDWWKAAGIRAVHTMAQVALGYITVGVAIEDVQWKLMLSTSLVAGVYSIIKSIAVGLPEVKDEGTDDETKSP